MEQLMLLFFCSFYMLDENTGRRDRSKDGLKFMRQRVKKLKDLVELELERHTAFSFLLSVKIQK